MSMPTKRTPLPASAPTHPPTGETLLRLVADALPALVAYVGADYRYRFANKTYREWTGRDPKSIEGLHVREVMGELGWRKIGDYARRALAGERVTFELEHIYKMEGAPRHIRATYTPDRTPDGVVRGFVVLSNDITAQHRAEEELDRSQRLFQRIADTSPDILFLFDVRDMRTVYTNREIHLTLGYSAAQAEEMGPAILQRLIHPDDLESAASHYANSFETAPDGDVLIHEHRIRHADGSWRWLRDRCTIFSRDPDGRPRTVLGVATDVTDFKQHAHALHQSEERFRATARATGITLFHQDASLRYTWLQNPTSGFSAASLIGKTDADVPPGRVEDLPALIAAKREVIATGRGARLEVVTKSVYGSRQFHDLVLEPLRDQEGNVVGLMGASRDVTETHAAQQAMRESEDRFRLAIRSSPVAISHQDAQLRFTFICNSPLGGDPDRFLGKTDEQILPNDEGRAIAAVKRNVLATGLGVRTELAITVQGVLRTFDTTIEPRRDDAGRVIGITSAAVDITNRKRAEEDLRTAREYVQFVIDAMPISVAHCGPDRRFRFVNRAYAARYDLTPPDVVGRHIGELMGEQAYLRVRPYVDRAVAGQEVDYEVLFPYPNRAPQWIGIRYVPARDSQGRVDGWIAAISDISERKRAEDALRSSEERFRLATQAMSGYVFDWDLKTNKVLRTAGVADVLGYTPAEVEATNDWWRRHVHPDDERTLDDARRVALGGHDSLSVEYRIRHKLGHYVHAAVRASVLRDPATGEPLRLVGGVTDVTALKRAEDDLRRAKDAAEAANAAKDRFLAVLSHELRTPLTPVVTAAELLASDPTLPCDLRESVDMIRRNVALETRLIDDLLDLTRIARGKIQVRPALTDVHEKIAHTLSICQSDLRAKRIHLTTDLLAPEHHAMVDPARLHQMVWNLLKNATKFTPEGGSIALRTRNTPSSHLATGNSQPATALVIEVSDTGIGIPPETLPRLFNAFEQGDPTISRKFGGLGLGLAICKSLADLHQGSLTAHSDGEGKGATFILILPTASPSPLSPQSSVLNPPPDPQSEIRNPQCLKVLLVEDHPDTATALSRLLRSAGHAVSVADSVAAALRAASSDRFDLLLSDIGLPDGSGHDLMRQLLARYPLKGIAMSGFGMEDDIARSHAAGFHCHLTKPVDLRQLHAAMRQLSPPPAT